MSDDTAVAVAARPPGRANAAAAVPQRAADLELIGELEDSGFEDPPSLVRRGDGQVVQLTDLLYETLAAVDGTRDEAAIAGEVSARVGRSVTADNVHFLLEQKLRPLGLLRLADGSEPATKKVNPLLALRWRAVLFSERATKRLTAPFAALFHPVVVAVVLVGFIVMCSWVLFSRGLAAGTREALYSPGLLLLIFGLTILSAGFHEFGHAAACRYGGAEPGVMGAGIYLVWPAFYTDVTDAYRLGRGGRLRTDLGGLYFNAVFLLGVFGLWAVTGAEALLLAVPLQLFQMVHQLLPFIRMDGYYILSDLTGVPDLFNRIKPTLKSALPGTTPDERAMRLKRWVRIVVTLWVLLVIPLLLVCTVLAIISLPRVAATAWDSLGDQADQLSAAVSQGDIPVVALRVLMIIAIALPVASTVYILGRIARRVVQRLWGLTGRRPALRAPLGAALALAAVGLVALWWPNGEYTPIRPGERGTVLDGVGAADEVPGGRPGLTDEREEELDAASPTADRAPSAVPTATTVPPTTPETTASSATAAATPSTTTRAGATPSPSPSPTTTDATDATDATDETTATTVETTTSPTTTSVTTTSEPAASTTTEATP